MAAVKESEQAWELGGHGGLIKDQFMEQMSPFFFPPRVCVCVSFSHTHTYNYTICLGKCLCTAADQPERKALQVLQSHGGSNLNASPPTALVVHGACGQATPVCTAFPESYSCLVLKYAFI